MYSKCVTVRDKQLDEKSMIKVKKINFSCIFY